MMRFLIITILSFATAPLWGVSYTLTPGSFPSVLRKITETKPETVALSGEASASELQSLKRLPASVANLDLSQLTIKGDDSYANGVLPPFALFATHIKHLTLPESLKNIGEGALAETQLESVAIPSTVGTVGPRVFYNCKSLKRVDMSEARVWEIKEECFSGCTMLEELQLPPILSEIGDRALMRTAVRSLAIPNVWRIGRFALAEMPSLSDITLKKGVEVEDGAFFNTPNLPPFDGFTFTSPALGFTMSGNVADGNVIDDSVIHEGAFAGSRLTDIKIGRHVETIEPHAFRNIEGVQTVDVRAKGDKIPALSEEAFSGVDVSKVRLLITQDNEQGWRETPGWKDFMIEVPAGLDAVVSDTNAITITGYQGIIDVRSEQPIDYIGVYSLSGMLLFERHDCGETLSAGPFADKEVIVRVLSGNLVKVATILIN